MLGRTARVTSTVDGWPPRRIESWIVSPGALWARTASSGCSVSIFVWPIAVMMSPGWMPAASAGEPAVIGGLPFWSASRETSAPTLTGRLSVFAGCASMSS